MQEMHWPLLDRVYLILLEVVATATVLATVVYWPAQRKKHSRVARAAYLMEGANAGVLLLEMLLSRVPFVSYHWQVSIVCRHGRRLCATCGRHAPLISWPWLRVMTAMCALECQGPCTLLLRVPSVPLHSAAPCCLTAFSQAACTGKCLRMSAAVGICYSCMSGNRECCQGDPLPSCPVLSCTTPLRV